MSSYQIDINDKKLVLRTTSFKAEKGSVLHSDIFSRELASALSAGAVLTLLGFFFAGNFKVTIVHYLIAIILFSALFLIFRSYIFVESILETVVDKDGGVITVSLKRITGEMKETFPLSELAGIGVRHITLKPENPDGMRVVENVSLQHGTVMPGFGEAEEFYAAEIGVKSGRQILVFSSKETSEADEITRRLKNFIES